MSRCQRKIQNNILKIFKKIFSHGIGNDLRSENTKFYGKVLIKVKSEPERPKTIKKRPKTI